MNILITGSNSGLGREMFDALTKAGHNVIGYDKINGHDVCRPEIVTTELDVLINNAGVNLIDWIDNFTEMEWDQVMNTNAKGIFLMTKAYLPQLIASKGTVLNIVSNASHMPMTCSTAYNASKGAAHIMTLQMARELTKRYGITVFGISPNKLAGTIMSNKIDEQVVRTRGWTKEFAQQYQLNGLLTGEETDPKAVAELVAFLLQDKAHHKALAGCVLPYGA